ncbi:MAG: type II toxin-antitoxin system VapC family toxin [Niveispirillum sp.]|uniref:type II toxin-antitoxin system VapC family toxin n=1 Tax=Niveispirillum sp. TaxID=1917217 RepID=UPI004035A031
MLDTNSVSHLIREHPMVVRRVVSAPMTALCLSAVTEAELRYGLAKRPEATRLHRVVGELLLRLDVLPWDSDVARIYGETRAAMERQGKALAPLDLMIAAHAIATGCTLVSNDQAFAQLPGLALEDWMTG